MIRILSQEKELWTERRQTDLYGFCLSHLPKGIYFAEGGDNAQVGSNP